MTNMDQNRRQGVEDADATGMIAGEELITQAETVLPSMLSRPEPPSRELHAALPPEHEGHATIDRLHAAVQAEKPDRAAIEEHVARLRGLPELETAIANWWESPSTQRFVWNLSQIGL